MKKSIFFIFSLFILTQCQEEKPLLEQAIEARCNCLKTFDKEKGNFLEVIECSDEINAREEFSNLDQVKIMEGMEKNCPDAALPLNEMIQ
ncbi:MAG: lipoprotein [Flavobacteriales bacterium]|jgi:hypothetical protein